MNRNKLVSILLVLMMIVLVCTGCSKPAATPEETSQTPENTAEAAAEEPAEEMPTEPAAPVTEEWYFARAMMDGKIKTAEQLGRYMHITLREDGSAENEQNGTPVTGTWEKKDGLVTITFGKSSSTFAEENGELVQMYDEQNGMFFTHEVAGTYIPGKVREATDVSEFDGNWNVKWIWSANGCQSVEYLQEAFGLDNLFLVLENGALVMDDADYGMTLNSGRLVFGTADVLKKVIALLDDGMLSYIDYETQSIYYCEKAQ